MFGVAAALSLPGVVLGAADAAGSGIDLTSVLSAGVTPAIVLLLVLVGKLVPGNIADQLRKDKEQAETMRDNLTEQMLTQVIPALTLATDVMHKLTPLVEAAAAGRADGG